MREREREREREKEENPPEKRNRKERGVGAGQNVCNYTYGGRAGAAQQLDNNDPLKCQYVNVNDSRNMMDPARPQRLFRIPFHSIIFPSFP